MTTPIAHKGVVAGAKVQAMTIIDLLVRAQLVKDAWNYFTSVQTKETQYTPFIAADTPAPIWLNKETMDRWRPELKKFYYDPARYGTYLEQLGIAYPTLRRPDAAR
jgi:aminobenzoyl-glutamate utilization protein B